MARRVGGIGAGAKAPALLGSLIVGGLLAAACSSPAAIPPSSTSGSSSPVTTAVGTPSQLLNAGVAALNAKDPTVAATDFQAVLKADPGDKTGVDDIAFYDLGVASQNEGNISQAEHYYANALYLNPKYTGALYDLAIDESAKDPSYAISLYQRAIASSPDDVNALYNLGLLLIQTGQTTQGEAYLNQALKLDPSIRTQKLSTSPTS